MVSADQARPSAVEKLPSSSRQGSAAEVFVVALGLGLTSFGGPIAHLGYFERAYVRRRGWLSAEDYAGLVALCQTIPGPASSQVGFLIGLRRALAGFPLRRWLGERPVARGALAGVNAAVVGVLAAALYNPIWIGAIFKPADLIIVVVVLGLLQLWRTPPILVAGLCVVGAVVAR